MTARILYPGEGGFEIGPRESKPERAAKIESEIAAVTAHAVFGTTKRIVHYLVAIGKDGTVAECAEIEARIESAVRKELEAFSNQAKGAH